jgi:Cu-Zn family superoxide dismutase
MSNLRIPLLTAAVIALAACNTTPAGDDDIMDAGMATATDAGAAAGTAPAADAGATSAPVSSATVHLASASGSLVSGTINLMPMGNGVHLTGEVGGLQPGTFHGFHIHENGDCSAPDASSAGGHFNPTGMPHGRQDTPSHHAGDMDNIIANEQGVAQIDAHLEEATLGGGGETDILGRALIVHADPDDYTSQPSGSAGARVACGVITAGM